MQGAEDLLHALRPRALLESQQVLDQAIDQLLRLGDEVGAQLRIETDLVAQSVAPSGGQRIAPVTTDTSGAATFSWTVDPATPPGSWRMDATCAGQVFSTHVPIE